MCYVTLDVDGNQLSWSLGWENKATKVDGTAAWWRHADGMTVTRGGSSLTNVIWTELVLVAAHSNLHIESHIIVIILLPLHLNLDTCGALWAVHGWLATAEYILTSSPLATHVTGYMAHAALLLHRHGGTLGCKGLVIADTAQVGHQSDVTLFLLMGEAKNIRLKKVLY